jgi:4-amino-4-deoxy-L-arabinose transferase-like glycosyltransferase
VEVDVSGPDAAQSTATRDRSEKPYADGIIAPTGAATSVPATPERSLPTPAARWRAQARRRDRLKRELERAVARGMSVEGAILVVALFFGALLRLWQINHLGLNSDEAVYAGQAAAIGGEKSLEPFFSAFRAHPVLFQTILSFFFKVGDIDFWGRLVSAGLGLVNIFVVYKLGELLYSRRAGAIAALFMALMPYHVLVTRQILLDGPMTLFLTLSLYLIARFAISRSAPLLYAAGAAMGLAMLSKETSIVMMGAVYAFFALTPEIRLKVRDVVGSLGVFGAVVMVFPVALSLAGRSETGGNYLAWQLFRRPNHEWTFYPAEVPEAIGFLVLVAAAVGLWKLRREHSWREMLLLCWIAVPVVFFQIWPVKGFQYLLPTAPAFALLAAQALVRLSPRESFTIRGRALGQRALLVTPLAVGVVALSLVIPTLQRIQPSESGQLLAGSGGVPGGREAGEWIDANVPRGAQLMTIGPSMANIVQFYGHRKAYGLSVSTNPLHRNPSYEPLANPDRLIRDNQLQYVVWDSFSAARSGFFARAVKRFADRYNGRAVHTETITVTTAGGEKVKKPLITIYEVRPS